MDVFRDIAWYEIRLEKNLTRTKKEKKKKQKKRYPPVSSSILFVILRIACRINREWSHRKRSDSNERIGEFFSTDRSQVIEAAQPIRLW